MHLEGPFLSPVVLEVIAEGMWGTTETVNRALEEVARRAALRRLAEWRFDHLEPDWLEKLRASDHYAPDEHDRVE